MKKVVTFGEIMLRLTPPGNLRFSQAQSFDVVYGGSESNVAVSLTNFGIPTEFVTRLPQNDFGDAAVMDMRKYGVGTQHIIRGGERLGIYFLEMGAVNRGSKVVYDRAHSSIATIQPGMIDWDTVFQDAAWFHWSGITPGVSQSAADACLEAVQAAHRLGLRISTDFNYRQNLWQYGKKPKEIMPKLVEYCDVVLAQKGDAELCFDMNLDPSISRMDFFHELMAKFPSIKTIASTRRKSISASHNNWSALLYAEGKTYKAPTYQITDIVDRVGGGDSFVGALIYGLLTYPDDLQTAIDFATAASCLKHTIYGDVNLATREEVLKLMGGNGSGRVSR